MARFKTVQRRFTQGELDPKMLGRADVDQYYGAAATARNVFPLPQGGFKRRPGLEYRDRIMGQVTSITGTVTAPNGGTTANLMDNNSATVLSTTTGISTTNPYVVFQVDLGVSKRIGFVAIIDFKISTGTSPAEWFMQGSLDSVSWTTFDSAMTPTVAGVSHVKIARANYRYIRLARIGSTDLSTATINVDDFFIYEETSQTGNVKLIDFVFNVDDTFLLVLSDKLLTIYLNGTKTIDIDVPEITNALIPDIDWVQSADTLLLFHPDLQTLSVRRTSSGNWRRTAVTFENPPTYDFGGITYGSITMTPGATTGATTLTASSSIFTAAMVGWMYRSFDRNGYARITGYTSGTQVNITIVDAFDATTASTDYALEEPIWSSTRGWPRHGVFHQNRLYLDGGKSRPAVAYGSVVNDFFNFNFGTALDDQAIGPLGGGELNPIQALYSSTSLMVFTSGGEYVALQSLGEPLTPANSALTQQSKIGTEVNVRPQEADGGVLFIQRGGRSVQEFLFDDTQNRFANNLLSLLSNHLITGISMSALRKANSSDDGSYLLLVRDDGSLVVGNILSRQNVASFTLQTTDGLFKACGVDKDDMYFAVQRNINGVDVMYLERFNNAFTTDCAKEYTSGLPAETFTGLDHLESETLFVLADGNLLTNELVTGGQITIDRNAETRLEVGLNYTPVVKDLPVENEQLGSVYGMKVNISEIVLDLLETKHVTLAVGDGAAKEISFRGFGPDILDTETPSFTGRKRVVGWRGWDDTGQVTISQAYPLPMTVLAVAKRVSV